MSIQTGLRRAAPDAALAAGVAVVALSSAAIAPPGRTALDLPGYLLLLAGPLALVACRRAPVPALCATTACVLAYLLRGYPGVAAALPVMVALVFAVRTGHRRSALIPAAAVVAVLVADIAVIAGQDVRQVVEDRFLLPGWLVASGILGETFRQWEAYTRQVEERAAEAERTREEAALRRAGEERLRIARELHDSLTHCISIIKVQAGVAIHLARKRGEDVPEALLAVEEAGADAMAELRATLEVLRDTGDGNGTEDGSDRLDRLVERIRAAGLPTELAITGAARPLPGDLDRAVYRIVQEALTNVTRHAGPATAVAAIDYGAGTVTVRVDDDGLGAPDSSFEPGVGLRGMRERVAALGGELRAGPGAEGGFSVRAEFPVPPPDPPAAGHHGGTDHGAADHGAADHEVKERA
jgi:signal transduction histidine kinase